MGNSITPPKPIEQMKKTALILTLALFFGTTAFAQVLVGVNPVSLPDQDAMVKMEGTSGGFTMPRMTRNQRLAIPAPVKGLTVYQTNDQKGIYIFNDPSWTLMKTPRKEDGKIKINMDTDTYQGIIGTGFNAVQVGGAGSNEVQVNFTAPFTSTPNVIISSEPFPPIPAIDGTYLYCGPIHNQNCVPAFAADYIDDIILESAPGGAIVPAFGFANINSNCDNLPANYVDHFDNPAYQATVYGTCGAPGSFFNVGIRSSFEWSDDLFVMIDWNQDADFFDANEVVVEKYLAPGEPADILWFEYGVTVPLDANNGVTVMRCMSMWASSIPEPCGTHTWGETEDYQLTVTNACGLAVSDDRGSNCSINTVSNTGFRVSCTDLQGVAKPASFSFYATE
jgi:hypothetical protein